MPLYKTDTTFLYSLINFRPAIGDVGGHSCPPLRFRNREAKLRAPLMPRDVSLSDSKCWTDVSRHNWGTRECMGRAGRVSSATKDSQPQAMNSPSAQAMNSPPIIKKISSPWIFLVRSEVFKFTRNMRNVLKQMKN